MWFNINFDILAIQMLPNKNRKPIIVAYAQSILKPIDTLHYLWKQKRIDSLYKLDHTGQICYLRGALNDKFDPSLRRIYIDDGNAFPRKYIYTRAENHPVFLGKMYINQNSEYINTGADFFVYVPQSIIDTQMEKLNAVIEYYRLSSKRYKIQPI